MSGMVLTEMYVCVLCLSSLRTETKHRIFIMQGRETGKTLKGIDVQFLLNAYAEKGI